MVIREHLIVYHYLRNFYTAIKSEKWVTVLLCKYGDSIPISSLVNYGQFILIGILSLEFQGTSE